MMRSTSTLGFVDKVKPYIIWLWVQNLISKHMLFQNACKNVLSCPFCEQKMSAYFIQHIHIICAY